MALVFLLGGARSGKSALALRLAELRAGPVVFLATGEVRDEEMRARIERHRAQRPSSWQTIEEPLELSEALERIPPDACAVVDCLSLWISNLLELGLDEALIEERAREAAAIASRRSGSTIVVSNEVGLGIVPASELGRHYRDLLGRVNAIWAEAASLSALVVAGRLLRLEPVGLLLGGASD